MEHETDEDLIARSRVASGLEERNRIIEQLFERHYSRVAVWCLRWTGNRDEAQDLAQEIFLKVHRSLDSFQGGSKFSTWLYMVCRNHCFNANAASRGKESLELDDALSATLSSSDPNPEQAFAANARWLGAKEMMERHLDETERKVLLLHYVEGWSLPMVSRSLQLTNASGAKAYIVSGMRKLKSAADRWKAKGPKA